MIPRSRYFKPKPIKEYQNKRNTSKTLGLARHVSVSGKMFEALNKSIIYLWWRDTECLYIGMSKRGLFRLYDHHVIKLKDIQWDDRFEIRICHGPLEAYELEQKLIGRLQPRYNKIGLMTPIS